MVDSVAGFFRPPCPSGRFAARCHGSPGRPVVVSGVRERRFETCSEWRAPRRLNVMLVLADRGITIMFLPALVFMCATMHRLARARRGSRVHRLDVQSAIAAWVLLPTAFLWCLASPRAESPDFDRILEALTLAAFAALLVTLALVSLAWACAAREARRWRRGQPPSQPGIDFGLGDDWVCAVPSEAPYRSTEQFEVVASGSPVAAAAALRWNVGALVAVSVAMGVVTWLTLSAQGTGCPHPACHHVRRHAEFIMP